MFNWIKHLFSFTKHNNKCEENHSVYDTIVNLLRDENIDIETIYSLYDKDYVDFVMECEHIER